MVITEHQKLLCSLLSVQSIYFFEFLNHTRNKLDIIITLNLIWERENSDWQNNLFDVL